MTAHEENPGDRARRELFRKLAQPYIAAQLGIPLLEIATREIHDSATDTESEHDCD